MRISDDARKCVVYIGYGDPSKEDAINPCGTGFFVTTGETGGTYRLSFKRRSRLLPSFEAEYEC